MDVFVVCCKDKRTSQGNTDKEKSAAKSTNKEEEKEFTKQKQSLLVMKD
jgi:hypothetical protein